jgi:hypothetical protein
VILVQADQADVLNAPTGAGEISIAGDVLFGATFAVTALYAALRKRMSRR